MSSGAAPASGDEPTVRGLAVGQRHFGRFVLVRPLGRGGMGIVWLARDESLGEEVALKFLPDLVRWDPAALAELKAETRRARQLTHPNIVRIHDLVEDAGGAAIAMEAIDGRTLTEERLARSSQVLEPAEILPWLGQLAAALDYAHREAKLVHRDLKPSNVMLTRDGRVKVTDFGVARAMGESMLRVSQIATTGGTLLYMSPQQALGEPPTPRDDIYALGATLYELLTGRPPFHTGNVAAQIERRRPDTIVERRRLLGVNAPADIPLEWEACIAACLAKQPEERPASAGEAAARMARSSAPRTGTWSNRGKWIWGRRAGLLAASVVLAGSAGVVAWRLWPATRVLAADVLGPGQAATVAPAAFASDAARAYAAWNFDGDGREASGRGWDFILNNAVPTTDRFGRIDAALRLNGGSAIHRELPEAVGWSAREAFSVALWVRPDSSVASGGEAGVLVSLASGRQEDLFWRLESTPAGVQFTLARTQIDTPDQAVALQPLPAGRWSHVAAVSDGVELRLYVDGREAAHQRVVQNFGARLSAPPHLNVGFFHKFDLERFAGAVDELRFWRRALRAGEVAQLAAPEPPPRFALTLGVYSATDDLAAAVRGEFGAEATLADWQELKRWHADDTETWCDALAVARLAGGPLVQNEGSRFSRSTRHYFLNRFDGKKPDYFLAHDELGGMRLALGSWHSVKGRALARLPHATPRTISLRADAVGKIVQEMPAATNARGPLVLAVEWRQELKLGTAPVARAEFVLRDGRQMAAVCAPAADGAFALALGAVDRPGLMRQSAGTFGPLHFSVVVRAGKLFFRAINPVGGGIVFQEELVVDFAAGDVARLTLVGVDSAELTTEE